MLRVLLQWQERELVKPAWFWGILVQFFKFRAINLINREKLTTTGHFHWICPNTGYLLSSWPRRGLSAWSSAVKSVPAELQLNLLVFLSHAFCASDLNDIEEGVSLRNANSLRKPATSLNSGLISGICPTGKKCQRWAYELELISLMFYHQDAPLNGIVGHLLMDIQVLNRMKILRPQLTKISWDFRGVATHSVNLSTCQDYKLIRQWHSSIATTIDNHTTVCYTFACIFTIWSSLPVLLFSTEFCFKIFVIFIAS